jgi:hypothetical protein
MIECKKCGKQTQGEIAECNDCMSATRERAMGAFEKKKKNK